MSLSLCCQEWINGVDRTRSYSMTTLIMVQGEQNTQPYTLRHVVDSDND